MIRTQEATGKTVDEARANACAKLGVQADDINVSYEVLEMPQKTGFLGLKLTPAKVRVTVEEADPVPAGTRGGRKSCSGSRGRGAQGRGEDPCGGSSRRSCSRRSSRCAARGRGGGRGCPC